MWRTSTFESIEQMSEILESLRRQAETKGIRYEAPTGSDEDAKDKKVAESADK